MEIENGNNKESPLEEGGVFETTGDQVPSYLSKAVRGSRNWNPFLFVF